MTSTNIERLTVEGMHCEGCVSRITKKVGEMGGVTSVEAHLSTGAVRVAWDDGFVGIEAVKARIRAMGYTVS